MRKLILLMINFLFLVSFTVCFATTAIQMIEDSPENNVATLHELEMNLSEKSGMIYIGFAICSDASSKFVQGNSNIQENFGHHSWISITNLGNISIDINGIEIPVFATITLGTWQSEIHAGIFFNAERYYAEKGGFSETESAYKMILLNDFEFNYLVSLLSNPTNDSWSIINNCSSFAERIWNDVSSIEVNAGIIKCPLKLYENILVIGGKKGLIISSPNTELYYGVRNPIKFEL